MDIRSIPVQEIIDLLSLSFNVFHDKWLLVSLLSQKEPNVYAGEFLDNQHSNCILIYVCLHTSFICLENPFTGLPKAVIDVYLYAFT